MKRRVYVICQKKGWDKGIPQVISDGAGQLEYIFASENGLGRGKEKVKVMNKNKGSNPVHLRKATLTIEEEIKNDAIEVKNE